MILFLSQLDVWTGTESSLEMLKSAQGTLESRFKSSMDLGKLQLHGADLLASQSSPKNDYADHYMITSHGGGVASVSVSGALVDSNIPLRAYGFSATTYGEIQKAVATLYKDPSIDKVVMTYNTPGGGFSGLSRTTDYISRVGKVKSVYTYASGQMASAGYWMGVVGEKIVADQAADVGSIGVYMTMVSYAEELKKAGIDVKIVRAGEFKALGHSAEPISEKALEDVQGRVDKIYDMFLEHTSQARGQPKEAFRKKAAEGRVFMGDDAVRVGLVDKVMLFDDFIDELLQSKSKVKSRSSASHTKLSETPKNMNILKLLQELGIELSDEQVAALSSGADYKTLGLSDEQVQKVEEKLAAEEGEADETETTDTAPKAAEGQPAAEPPPAAAPAAAQTATQDTSVLALTQKLLELQSDLTKANLSVASLTKALETSEASLATVQQTLTSMRVAVIDRTKALCSSLRTEIAGLEQLSDADLLDQFSKVKAKFEASFPVGQRSKPSSAPAAPAKPPESKLAAVRSATSF